MVNTLQENYEEYTKELKELQAKQSLDFRQLRESHGKVDKAVFIKAIEVLKTKGIDVPHISMCECFIMPSDVLIRFRDQLVELQGYYITWEELNAD